MGHGQRERMVRVGRISGLYGVRGWLRIHSFTDPRENIIAYRPWYLNQAGAWRSVQVEAGRRQGNLCRGRSCVDKWHNEGNRYRAGRDSS